MALKNKKLSTKTSSAIVRGASPPPDEESSCFGVGVCLWRPEAVLSFLFLFFSPADGAPPLQRSSAPTSSRSSLASAIVSLVGERRFFSLIWFWNLAKGKRGISCVARRVEKRKRESGRWRKKEVLFFRALCRRRQGEEEVRKKTLSERVFHFSVSFPLIASSCSKREQTRKRRVPFLLFVLSLSFFSHTFESSLCALCRRQKGGDRRATATMLVRSKRERPLPLLDCAIDRWSSRRSSFLLSSKRPTRSPPRFAHTLSPCVRKARSWTAPLALVTEESRSPLFASLLGERLLSKEMFSMLTRFISSSLSLSSPPPPPINRPSSRPSPTGSRACRSTRTGEFWLLVVVVKGEREKRVSSSMMLREGSNRLMPLFYLSLTASTLSLSRSLKPPIIQ